ARERRWLGGEPPDVPPRLKPRLLEQFIGEVAQPAGAPAHVGVQGREGLVVPRLPGARVAAEDGITQATLPPDAVGFVHAPATPEPPIDTHPGRGHPCIVAGEPFPSPLNEFF